MHAAMIAGSLGILTGWPAAIPTLVARSSATCPVATSDAHRPLLKAADEQVDAGRDLAAARTFVAAFDVMDLADQVSGTGRFAADRATTSYLQAWRLESNPGHLDEAEQFLTRYAQVRQSGEAEACEGVVEAAWVDEKLAEVRALRPTSPPPEGAPAAPASGRSEPCPSAPAIIGVDRVGVALVTVGASILVSGTAFLIAGLVSGDLAQNPAQGFAIAGGSLMGAGVAVLIPGAVRLGTWRRRQSDVRLGVAPWAGRGGAGLRVGGHFGVRR